MRWLDRYGRPRKLDDVFDEHLRAVRARLAHTMRTIRQSRAHRAERSDVIVRGNCVGGVYSGNESDVSDRIPDRNPLAW